MNTEIFEFPGGIVMPPVHPRRTLAVELAAGSPRMHSPSSCEFRRTGYLRSCAVIVRYRRKLLCGAAAALEQAHSSGPTCRRTITLRSQGKNSARPSNGRCKQH